MEINNNNTENTVTEKTEYDFAYKLNKLMPADRNYVFSPLSIKLILGIIANGAEGETQDEVFSLLGTDDVDGLNIHLQELIKNYTEGIRARNCIADSMWVNTSRVGDVTFSETFSEKIKKYFKAEVGCVTDRNAVRKINEWCSRNTRKTISEIINSPAFSAIVLNVIYFRGMWTEPFEKENTKKRKFTDRNGLSKETDFMCMTSLFYYYEDDGTKALKLPYKGDMSMYIILNGDRKVTDFSEISKKMKPYDVNISIPKFRIDYDGSIKDMLYDLGIRKAFDGKNAEFYGMFSDYTPDHPFYIDNLIHKSIIDVDERGTVAAAATAELFGGYGTNLKIREFVADRPFTFIISDDINGEILFMGEYAYV